MGLVPSVSNRGSITFVNHSGIIKVFRALLKCYDKTTKTIASLCMSDCGLLSFNIGVSLASSSSYNHLISALVAIRSA